MKLNNSQIVDLMLETLKAAEIDINDSKKLLHLFKQVNPSVRKLFIRALQETGQENKVGKVYFILLDLENEISDLKNRIEKLEAG